MAPKAPLPSNIDKVIDAALGNSIVGCVVIVKQGGETIYQRAAGFADRENAKPVSIDTIFRLASVTKPIVATTALRLMEQGKLQLDDPVSRHSPWFKPKLDDGTAPVITLRQLLTHTSGITYDVPPNVSPGLAGPAISLEDNIRRLARLPLSFMPGQQWAYGMGIDVLGLVISSVAGTSLEDAIVSYVADPLGMPDTRFHVTDMNRMSVAYADDHPPRIMRDPDIVPEDDTRAIVFSPGRIFNGNAPQSGGGGMAGTASDIMKLLESYQASGTLLKPETRRLALTNQTDGIKMDAGRGFCLIGGTVTNSTAAKTPCPVGSVDWGGVYGLSWIIDTENHRTTLTCTNTALEGCTGKFPKRIRDAVYAE
jgi:CubicO group peptidase (beta-lactamase class C family)